MSTKDEKESTKPFMHNCNNVQDLQDYRTQKLYKYSFKEVESWEFWECSRLIADWDLRSSGELWRRLEILEILSNLNHLYYNGQWKERVALLNLIIFRCWISIIKLTRYRIIEFRTFDNYLLLLVNLEHLK